MTSSSLSVNRLIFDVFHTCSKNTPVNFAKAILILASTLPKSDDFCIVSQARCLSGLLEFNIDVAARYKSRAIFAFSSSTTAGGEIGLTSSSAFTTVCVSVSLWGKLSLLGSTVSGTCAKLSSPIEVRTLHVSMMVTRATKLWLRVGSFIFDDAP